jgi:hypothetical protein
MASSSTGAAAAAAAGATPTKGDRDGRGAMDLGTYPPVARLAFRPADPTRLATLADSPNFNPKLYYQDLIERSSLADLLKVQAELARGASRRVACRSPLQKARPLTGESLAWRRSICCYTEIRQLDQEKHDLIYGRHHDLVAASSTIQRVRPEGHLPA